MEGTTTGDDSVVVVLVLVVVVVVASSVLGTIEMEAEEFIASSFVAAVVVGVIGMLPAANADESDGSQDAGVLLVVVWCSSSAVAAVATAAGCSRPAVVSSLFITNVRNTAAATHPVRVRRLPAGGERERGCVSVCV